MIKFNKFSFLILSLVIAGSCLTQGQPAEARARKKAPDLVECDASIARAFSPEEQVTVLLAEKVRKGQPFPNPTMEQLVYPKVPASYGADLCHVKLLVGPPNPGPAEAPSTSRGLAFEIWLPERAAWNGRFHAIGNSGSTGSEEGLLDRISSWTGTIETRSAPRVAAEEGSVTATGDSGKGNDRSTSFLMNPDGTINNRAIHDYTTRTLREQAVKTKALIRAYYGSDPKFSYFDGASGGGRQAYHVVQNVPEQYDGVLGGVPALAWNALIATNYPALVIMRDLDGKPIAKASLDLVSNAAIAACDVVGGKHLGFIIDQASCRYDPLKDASVLCVADGGTNRTDACVTRRQALAINKMWYGMTIDGSVPDPAVDNGWGGHASGKRLWYGWPRGTDLSPIAQPNGMGIGIDMIAVITGDPKYGAADFRNARGNGQNGWRDLSYEQFALHFAKAHRILPDMDATNPDLSAFKARGGKFISVASGNDNLLLVQGITDYYDRVVRRMGGVSAVQNYFRLYISPGLGHGPRNGTANPNANPPAQGKGQMFKVMTDWVEKGIDPGRIVFSTDKLTGVETPAGSDHMSSRVVRSLPGAGDAPAVPESRQAGQSLPVCAWPAMLSYVEGDVSKAESYTCHVK